MDRSYCARVSSGRFTSRSYFICAKTTKSMMIAARTSAQLEISMPAIDVFWLNHSMWLYRTIRGDTDDQIAILSSLVARKATFLLALM